MKYDGKKNYVMHFDKGKLPPVNGFWSLTMYDEDYFFVDNPLNRYTLSQRDKLKANADGSIDLYIQHQSPGKAKESNWLPAPADPFILMMRLYWPKDHATVDTRRELEDPPRRRGFVAARIPAPRPAASAPPTAVKRCARDARGQIRSRRVRYRKNRPPGSPAKQLSPPCGQRTSIVVRFPQPSTPIVYSARWTPAITGPCTAGWVTSRRGLRRSPSDNSYRIWLA